MVQRASEAAFVLKKNLEEDAYAKHPLGYVELNDPDPANVKSSNVASLQSSRERETRPLDSHVPLVIFVYDQGDCGGGGGSGGGEGGAYSVTSKVDVPVYPLSSVSLNSSA